MAVISIIAAMNKEGIIGKDNALPWHISEDLQHFKKLTTCKPIVMGRKTFESIGRPLPQRLNIVITRDKNFSVEGVTVVHSSDEAIAVAENSGENLEEIMIIGGGQIYAEFLPIADKIYLTEVDMVIDIDDTARDCNLTFFPKLDRQEWQIISQEKHEAKSDNPSFSFLELVKIKT